MYCHIKSCEVRGVRFSNTSLIISAKTSNSSLETRADCSYGRYSKSSSPMLSCLHLFSHTLPNPTPPCLLQERRHRRSRSRSRDKYRPRRRSRSRERRRSPSVSEGGHGGTEYDPNRPRRRPTWFDIPPIGGAPPPLSQLPGAVNVVPDSINLASIEAGPMGFGGGASNQATRHARRIYMGSLPPGATEDDIAGFLSSALTAIGGTTAGPGNCVLNVYLNHEKRFAFVELRTVEETSNAMALDGVVFEEHSVRIRRPADYRVAEAAALGPSLPNPNLNLAAVGLDKREIQQQQALAAQQAVNMMQAPGGGISAVGPGGAAPTADPTPHAGGERIFVGGLPYYLNEEQCRELLGSFGTIHSFDLIKDKETGQGKGYGFVVYQDPSVSDIAIAGLNGMRMGEKSLTVKRSHSSAAYREQRHRTDIIHGTTERTQQQHQQPSIQGGELGAQQQGGAEEGGGGALISTLPTGIPPRVVKLIDAVTPEELANDDDYEDILEDMKEECGKYGNVVAVHIPRPSADGSPPPPGLGKIIVEFEENSGAMAARNAIHGRKFAGNTVQALLMTAEDYEEKRWD